MGVLMEPSFQFRDGSLVTERGAKKVHSFGVGNRQQPGHLGRHLGGVLAPAHLSRASRTSRSTSAGSAARAARCRASRSWGRACPRSQACSKATGAAVERFVKTSTGGPDEEARKSGGSLFVAEALDESGQRDRDRRAPAASAGYEFTGLILAWAAEETAGGRSGTGGRGRARARRGIRPRSPRGGVRGVRNQAFRRR